MSLPALSPMLRACSAVQVCDAAAFIWMRSDPASRTGNLLGRTSEGKAASQLRSVRLGLPALAAEGCASYIPIHWTGQPQPGTRRLPSGTAHAFWPGLATVNRSLPWFCFFSPSWLPYLTCTTAAYILRGNSWSHPVMRRRVRLQSLLLTLKQETFCGCHYFVFF